MNIAILINTLLSGGAEKQAVLLAKYIQYDHNVTLIVWHGDQVESKFLEDQKFKVSLLEGNVFQKLIELKKLKRKHNIDLMFSYLLKTNLVNGIFGRLMGIKYRVGGIRNAYLEPNKEGIQRFIHNYLCTHTIFNNKKGIENLVGKGFRKPKCYYIGNCFEINDSAKITNDSIKSVLQIVTVGRFVAQKDYPTAIMVAKLLRDSGFKFKYTIIGFGELENEIRELVKKHALDNFIEIVINPKNINEYYLRANVYLCTSLFEGLSNTVMEAMSFNLPVVATNVGDNDLLVKDGFNGFLVKIKNSEQMAEHIQSLSKNVDLIVEMGLNSRKLLEENFTQNIFKSKYLRFIDNLSN